MSPRGSTLVGKPTSVEEYETEEEDDEFESEEEQGRRQEKSLLMPSVLAANRTPKVPTMPAPPCFPVRKPKQLPADLIARGSETTIDRVMNSSSGRFLTFTLTLLSFVGSSVGFVVWQASQAAGTLVGALASTGVMYTVLPALARKAGMAPSERGVDWKPYFVLYRMSYFTAIPSYTLLALGYGAKAGFGSAQGPAGQVSLYDLDKDSTNYFAARDGFVALNLTRGVAETLRSSVHGLSPRRSKFRNAELKVNRERFSTQAEPTVPPGAVRMYHMAPVFAYWSECLTKYAVSTTCLQQNQVVAWVVATTSSFCSMLHMVACKNPQPVLDPLYHCSSEPRHGRDFPLSITGLCGRVALRPRDGVIDEYTAMLLEEGWPQAVTPNSTSVWLDIQGDSCILEPDACASSWNLLGGIGVALCVATALFILVPCVLDCVVDKRIREARRLVEESQKTNFRVVT